MSVLIYTERKALEKSVLEAHQKAETGAIKALKYLGVKEDKKPSHLNEREAELRRKLRVEQRRLGSFEVLVNSVAYEHWHRMLFARFLAENNLLIHPKFKIPVSLSDINEIADEEGSEPWEVAAGFASYMLPGIFRQDDPLLMVDYAPEDRMALQNVLDNISSQTFLAEDALGWTYQFWQSEKKREVNASERKIEGYDICAVTQLFTEPYMVKFLLENTLGAWWLSIHPESSLKSEWEFYRSEVEHDFSGWPVDIDELKILDPCCGSGHFLVRAFHMLLSMRREIGEKNEAAISAIISKNLHGLELDPRCIQIATFALALEAWKEGFSPTDSYLPVPNLACTGIPIKTEKEEWLKLAGDDGMLENALREYYDLFKNADSLGSLIQIEDSKESLIDQKTLMKKLEQALKKEMPSKETNAKNIGFNLPFRLPLRFESFARDPVAETFGETANAVLKAAEYLRRTDFHLVITNPPFLGYKKTGKILKKYCEKRYIEAKHDIATCFFIRCLNFSKFSNTIALVSPQNWTFISSYTKLRENLLENTKILTIANLGSGAFETISGEVVQVVLNIFENKKNLNHEHSFYAIDASEHSKIDEKIDVLKNKTGINISQFIQKDNPDSRIVFENISNHPLLSNYAISMRGVVTGDGEKWIHKFWELKRNDIWNYHQSTVKDINYYSGREHIINWIDNGKNMLRPGIENEAYGKKGIVVSQMSNLSTTLYSGDLYDNNVGVLIPHDSSLIPSLWVFCSSQEYKKSIRSIDKTLAITNATLIKVPFDLEYWQKVAEEKYPNGLPEPYSDDPTQWLFHGHPKPSESPLHVAIARLLGYRWPAETDTEMELSKKTKDWITESEKLLSFADDDGIVCIPSVRGEGRMADRVREILSVAFGSEWSGSLEEKILSELGFVKSDGSLKGDLEKFLREEFFKSHCKLFQNRPFIWHIWDGEKDGFSVIVNYHKLDRRNLERLIYSYLGPWISQQEREKADNIAGAEKRFVAAKNLKEKLELILKGEKPYDIYVRWKSLKEQPIGWEPDINDGVRLNIRPFIEAGVLRWNPPSIKWGIDRGKDAEPNCSGTVERHNDLHFSLEEKRKARGE